MPTSAEKPRRRSTLHPAAVAIVSASIFIAGLIAVHSGASRVLAAHASRQWMKTTGVIIESRADSNCARCPLTIQYHYVVNGESLVGDRIVAGSQDSYYAGDAAAKAHLYTVGRKLSVFYDPTRPEFACLEPGVFRGSVYLFFALGGFLIGTSTFLLFLVFRKPIISQPSPQQKSPRR